MHERFVIHVFIMLRGLRLPIQNQSCPEGHGLDDLDPLELRVLVVFEGGHPHPHRVVRGDLLVEPEGARHLGLLLVVVGHGFASVASGLLLCFVLLQRCGARIGATCKSVATADRCN